MADGSIRIDVSLNKDNLKADLNDLKNMAESASKSIQQSVNKVVNSMGSSKNIQKATDTLNKSIDKSEKKIQELQEELDNLDVQKDIIIETTRENTPAFYNDTPETIDARVERELSLNKDFQDLEAKEQEIIQKMNEYQEAINNAKSQVDILNQALDRSTQMEEAQASITQKLADQQFLGRIKSEEQYDSLLQQTFDMMKTIEDEAERLSESSGLNYDDIINANEQYQSLYHTLMLLINAQDQFKSGPSFDMFSNIGDNLGTSISTVSQLYEAGNAFLGIVGKIKTAISVVQSGIKKATSYVKKLKDDFEKVINTIKKVGSTIKSLGSKISSLIPHFGKAKKEGQSFGDGVANSAERGIKKLGKMALAVFGARSAFMAVRKAINQYLETNEAVSNKISGMWQSVANAIGPVINVVVDGVAKIMSYVNSLYKAFTGKDLFKAVSAVSDSTSSAADSAKKLADNAKEAKRQLAGFDEMQVLSSDDTSSGSGSSGGGGGSGSGASFTADSFDVSAIKAKLEELFEPLQNAWEKYGEQFTTSFKNALTSIWDMVKSIGKSFEEVWTNGTGQETCELILKILINVFDTVANIAKGFTEAWNKAGLGTAIIQDLWDILNNVLKCIEYITEGLAKIAGKIDFTPLLTAIKSVTGLFKDLSDEVSKTVKNIVDNLVNGDFSSAGSSLSKGLSNMAKTITNFVNSIDWDSIGKNMAKIANKMVDFFNAIDWTGLAWDFVAILKAIGNGIGKAAKSFSQEFNSKDFKNMATNMVKALCTAIEECGSMVVTSFNNFLKNTDWGDIGKYLGDLSNAILKVVNKIDWNAIADAISKIVRNWATTFDWGTFMETCLEALLAAVKLKHQIIFDIAASIAGNLLTHLCDSMYNGASNMWNSLKKGWKALGSLALSLGAKISTTAGKLRDNLKSGWGKLKDKTVSLGAKISTTAGKLYSNLKSAWGKAAKAGLKIKLTVSSIVGNIKGWINSNIISPINKHLPLGIKIPKLARGGIINTPTQFIAGEAGMEAILPLQNNTQWMDDLASKLVEKMDITNNQGNTTIILKVGDTDMYRWMVNMQKKSNLILNGG